VPLTVPLPLAVVLTSFDPGGTERQMIELVRRLDSARWQVHVACFRARGAWFGRVAEAAASVAEFPVHSLRHPSTVQQMRSFAGWCRDLRIAVVHAAELYANIFALPAAALARVPVRVGNRRELNPDKTQAQIATQRAAYAFAHKVVANSQAAADRLLLERVPQEKIAVIPNGLNLQQFKPRQARSPLRKVIVVANLRAEKGHDVLVDAAAIVGRRFPDATFEIVGDGPERARLVARAREAGVAGVCTFLGHRDDVPARLGASDIFVLPSRSEAFPNAVLEAMATGLPVVASGVGGILELVDDGRTGLLVPSDDPAALADRLCGLMANPSLGATLGGAARAEVEGHYSFDRMVSAFDQLYASELEAGRGVPARHRRAAQYVTRMLPNRFQAGH
jgi:glycosyltransferase involved in cell wall biosynthesis